MSNSHGLAASSLFRNSSFCRLWGAQFSSMSVVYGLGLAGVVVIEDLTHSSAQTGLVIVSSILPAFAAAFVAGAVVDRFGRLPVLLVSLAARVLIALAFWAGTQLKSPGLVLATVYAVNVAGIAITQFAASAESSLLPDLVEPERLLPANALFQASLLAAEGLGIVVVAPLVIKLAGAPAMGAVGALLYLVALILAATLRRGRTAAAPSAPATRTGWRTFGSDLQAGWRIIARDRLLGLVTAQVTLAGVLLLVLLSMVPGLLSRHLGLGAEDTPFLLLPGGIGFVIGLFVIGRWERRLRRSVWVAGGLITLGGVIGLFAMVSRSESTASLWLSVPLIVATGLALATVIVPARTVLQERPPAEMRGRVIAAQLALGNAAAVLPLLVGGILADWLGIQSVIGLLGLVALSTGAIGLHYARS